jgi:hypothetical phospholipase C
MQENRAFDHYFGTMPGVRGFQDPNVMVSNNTGKTVFHQPVDDSILIPAPPKHVKEIKPFYLNWAGAEWNDKTQCMVAGTNSWQANHAAWNKGNNDHWALGNNVYSLGYYHKDDIPIQYELADKFTVGDMYFESVIASTIPNRVRGGQAPSIHHTAVRFPDPMCSGVVLSWTMTSFQAASLLAVVACTHACPSTGRRQQSTCKRGTFLGVCTRISTTSSTILSTTLRNSKLLH